MATPMYDPLSVLVNVTEIRAREPRVPSMHRPDDGFWIPPETRDDFVTTQEGQWMWWRQGYNIISVPPELDPTIETAFTTSMFWCQDHEQYRIVPYNCLTTHVRDQDQKWERIAFYDKLSHDGSCVSYADYHGEFSELRGRASSVWMPQLLPRSYKCNPHTHGHRDTHLAGDPSILFGLACFTAQPEHLGQVLTHHFIPSRDRKWVPHHLQFAPPEERAFRRGLVIKIGTSEGYVREDQRQYFRVTQRDLSLWENVPDNRAPTSPIVIFS